MLCLGFENFPNISLELIILRFTKMVETKKVFEIKKWNAVALWAWDM